MKIKMISTITAWKKYRNLEVGKIYDMPLEDGQRLIKNKAAIKVTTEFLGEEARKRVEAEVKKPTLANFTPERLEELAPPQKPVRKEKPKPEEKKRVEIDAELAEWLSEHGFIRNPEGIAYYKIVRLE